MPDSASNLDIAISIGAELQAALIRLLSPIDAELRAMTLARALGLDKSLASKTARCARLANPVEVLLDAPSPAGLRMVAEAAAGTGAPPERVAALGAIAERLDGFIDAFPGGRQALETSLAFQVPARRQVSDLRARRSILGAMARLTGFELDCFYTAYWYVPSEGAPDTCDNAWVGWTYGLRRHGNESRLLVGGINSTLSPTDLQRYSMSGDPIGNDPSRLLIPEFTTAPCDRIALHKSDRMLGLMLEGDMPVLGQSVNIAQGSWSVGTAPRTGTDENSWEYFWITTRRPTRVLVADLLLHEDVYPDAEPVIESRLAGNPFPLSTLGPEASEFDLIEQSYQLTRIDPVHRGLHCADAPGVDELLELVHRRRGWDPASMRVWRLRIECPLPMVDTLFWIRMPDAPSP